MSKEPPEWKALLLDSLREANVSSYHARLEWLCSHMDAYLDRFTGFAEQDVPIVDIVQEADGTQRMVPTGKEHRLPIETLVQGDLFIIIRVAAEVIESQMIEQPVDPHSKRLWDEFRNTVSWVERTQDLSDIGLLRETFDRFEAHLLR